MTPKQHQTLRALAFAKEPQSSPRYPVIEARDGWLTATDGAAMVRVYSPESGVNEGDPPELLDPKTLEASGVADFPEVQPLWDAAEQAQHVNVFKLDTTELARLTKGALSAERAHHVDFEATRSRFMARSTVKDQLVSRDTVQDMKPVRLGAALLARVLRAYKPGPVNIQFTGGLQPVRLRQVSEAGEVIVEALIMPQRRY